MLGVATLVVVLYHTIVLGDFVYTVDEKNTLLFCLYVICSIDTDYMYTVVLGALYFYFL